MKVGIFKHTLVTAIAFVLLQMTHAMTVAQFDLGQNNVSGWALITTSGLSNTDNGITLTAAGTGLDSRTRGGVATDVAEDFIFNNSTITFTFTGLLANQEYEFETYAFDNTGGGSESGDWYIGSILPGNLQHTWVNGSDSTNPFTLTATSDGGGSVTIIVDGNGTNNRANGFEVVLVPEPTSLGLVSLSALLLLRRRKS